LIADRSFTISYAPRDFYEASVIFELLAKNGCLNNNCALNTSYALRSYIPCFLGNICLMSKLETLNFWGCEIKVEEVVPLFRSCPKLVELYLRLNVSEKLKMDERLKNELGRGFQRLRLFELLCHIENSMWPVIQEMLT
jgi:hypothetical protein